MKPIAQHHAVLLTLLLTVLSLFALCGFHAPTLQAASPGTVTLLYSNNVQGETAPCG